MGAKVKFFGPQTLLFTDPAKLPVTVCENMEEAIYDADIKRLFNLNSLISLLHMCKKPQCPRKALGEFKVIA